MTRENTSAVDEAALSTLTASLDGRVIAPGDPDYDSLRTPWLEVLEQRPTIIVEAASADDVSAAVSFARAQGLPLGVMATGHGIAAACNDGLLINLSKMTEMTLNLETNVVTVGPGVDSGMLLAKTEPHGLVYPTGQVSSVGVIGYTLGGGMGWLVRKLSAAAGTVRRATVVLADGSLVHASTDENLDLFWALRGGGGNFGVVVALDLALSPVKEVVGGEIYYPLARAGEILRAYRDWSSGLSDETSTILRLLAPPPGQNVPAALKGKKTCMIGLCHADPQTADAVLQPLNSFGEPLLRNVKRRTISDMAQLDPASHLSASPTYSGVEFLEALSDEVIDQLVAVANTMIPPLMQLEVQQLGGALLRWGAEDGAFHASTAPYLLHLVSPATLKTSMDELAKVTRQAFDTVGDVFTGEAYYNFLRWNEKERVPQAFGEAEFQRLGEIKARYDPDNVFSLNLNIAPTSSGNG